MDVERIVVFCRPSLFSNTGAVIFISSFPCGGASIESSGRLCYWFVRAIFIVGASKSCSFGEILEKFLRTTGRNVAGFWTIIFSWNDDVVKYGASLYVCTTQHTSSGATLDETKFNLFVSGLEFEDSWASSTLYQLGIQIKNIGHIWWLTSFYFILNLNFWWFSCLYLTK